MDRLSVDLADFYETAGNSEVTSTRSVSSPNCNSDLYRDNPQMFVGR